MSLLEYIIFIDQYTMIYSILVLT